MCGRVRACACMVACMVADMHPGKTYTISLWVKTDKADGDVSVKFYTADNNEQGRLNGAYHAVAASDGWTRLVWTFTDPYESESDSMSFNWSGACGGALAVGGASAVAGGGGRGRWREG